MRDDLTIVYASTQELASRVARELQLPKNSYVTGSPRSAGFRGFVAGRGRIILVGDVILRSEHRAELEAVFSQCVDRLISILRISEEEYL